MANAMLRKFIRSPHLAEVFTSYGIGALVQLYFARYFEQSQVSSIIAYFGIGLMIYTFFEYWFHRMILHNLLEKAHNNHHATPRNLRIIATPILPVHIYDLFIISIFQLFLSLEIIYGINVGISIGQCIMDTVHVLFHTTFRPWYLESARSYHLHHHFVDGQTAHGLTTSFWDLIFGTYPKNWSYNKKNPWIIYCQLPFPVIGFLLISLLSGDESKTASPEITPKSNQNRIKPHGTMDYSNIAIAVTSAMFVVTTPYYF